MKWVKGAVFDGRYQIREIIGSGGMADVYKAYDNKKKRIVAIKVLREDIAENQEFIRRFQAEAQAVKQLSHEGIVRMYELGEIDGLPYIVLEYIDGKTLKQEIREEGALPPEKATGYAIQICEALYHAHQRHLVHRDVKPQNIMITRAGRIKIMDFGIARFVNANTQTYATDGNVLGSIHYVSPEQARGETVDESSDIYSTGIVLYEMLTGEVPFDNENSVTIVLRQISESIPSVLDKKSDVSPALNAIVQKATQKDKAFRYQTLQEMRRDLLRSRKEPEGNYIKIKGEKETEKGEQQGKQTRAFARTRFGSIVNVVVAAILGLGILVSAGMIIYTNSAKKNADYSFYIPQLVGKEVELAAQRCEDLDIVMEVSGYISSESYPAGQVARQEPITGTYGKSGDVVRVYVSTGPSEIEVPNVVDEQIKSAQTLLQQLGLEVEIHYELSDKPNGVVLHQSPIGGSVAEPGDYISVWISGTEDERITMPAVTAMRMDDAMQAVKNAGFGELTLRYVRDETVAGGQVLSQTPASGEKALPGTSPLIEATRPRNLVYIAELSWNLQLEGDSNLVTLSTVANWNGLQVETIWFEQNMRGGQQSVPATVEFDSPEPRDVTLKVNGVVERTQTVELIERPIQESVLEETEETTETDPQEGPAEETDGQ